MVTPVRALHFQPEQPSKQVKKTQSQSLFCKRKIPTVAIDGTLFAPPAGSVCVDELKTISSISLR
jgi:hypothetical protein